MKIFKVIKNNGFCINLARQHEALINMSVRMDFPSAGED